MTKLSREEPPSQREREKAVSGYQSRTRGRSCLASNQWPRTPGADEVVEKEAIIEDAAKKAMQRMKR
jgi:hypothetical protein